MAYSVQFIKKNRETFEQRLDIKNKGRPCPDIQLTQECSYKTKKFKRSFNTDQYQNVSWLCGCEETNKLFCFPCLIFGDGDSASAWCEIGVTDLAHLSTKIKKHSMSRSHLFNEVQLASLGRQDICEQLESAYRKTINGYNKQVDKNRYILSRLIDCVKYCGAFQVALQEHDESSTSLSPGMYQGLVDFVAEIDQAMKQHLTGTKVFKGTSKDLQNDILDAMLTVCQQEIIQQISSAEYVAVQVNETTDCATIQQLVVIIRYVQKGYIYERFWKLIQPENHTADTIASEIKKELEILKIRPKQLVGQSYDGASVMSSNVDGVQSIIKKTFPYASYVHCYAHQFNLILERSATINNTIKTFFANLHAFHTFFTQLPKQPDKLKEIVMHRIPSALPTRRKNNTQTIHIVHEHLEELKDCMIAVMESADTDHDTFNKAQMLASYMTDDDFLHWLNFFSQIMLHCEILFKQFQARSLDAVKMMTIFKTFENSVCKIRDEPELHSKKLEPDNLPQAVMRKEVCDVILAQARDRFSFTEHLLASKLLNTEMFSNFKKKFPLPEFKKVIKTYDFLDPNKLINELIVLYAREDLYGADGALSILQHLINGSLSEIFSESTKLICLICTIPMPTVESERCFPTMKNVKAFKCNTMAQDRLNALCMLSIESQLVQSIPDFNFRVIDAFSNAKNRRIDFVHKKLVI